MRKEPIHESQLSYHDCQRKYHDKIVLKDEYVLSKYHIYTARLLESPIHAKWSIPVVSRKS